MKYLRNILAFLGWVLAVLAIVHVVASVQPYRYATPENPMPAVETIQSIRFVERTGEADSEFIIPTNAFPMVSLLFEGSRKDGKPAAWQILGDLFITLRSGDTVQFDLYSTHQPTGAFKVDEQYYRGGIDEQFRKVLTQEISNKSLQRTR